MSKASISFHADGMHCHGCERVIESAAGQLDGVLSVRASYPTETVSVDYDPALTDVAVIAAAVEKQGYRVHDARPQRSAAQRFAIALAALAALAALILFDTRWISADGEPDVAQHLSLGLILLLGLLTGFHCIGMCGGFVVSYTARASGAPYFAHFSYGAGKTLSYTLIGAAFGWLGAFIAFTPLLRGAAGVAAGGFLIVFGLNMLGLFAPLRRFRFGLPAPLQRWINREAAGRHQPFVIGLLNGLMIACGPLQAMYVMAAGTGSPIEGAKMLFAFGIGTLPVLLAFGMLTSVLSGAATHRLLKASGVIVVALGAVMVNRGLILTGSGGDLASLVARMSAPLTPLPAPSGPQIIEMEANRFGYKPNRFTLTAGKPVKWVIDAVDVTNCNHRIVVPALNLEFDLKPGRQTIDFTPRQAGVIPWSCWMGMMRGAFDVVDAAAPQSPAAPPVGAEPAPPQTVPAPAAQARSYLVRRGDTFEKIARKFYGDGRRWREISAANGNLQAEKLEVGRLLTIP